MNAYQMAEERVRLPLQRVDREGERRYLTRLNKVHRVEMMQSEKPQDTFARWQPGFMHE